MADIQIGCQVAGKSFYVKHLNPEEYGVLSVEIKTDMGKINNIVYLLHTALTHYFAEMNLQMTNQNIELL